MKTVFNRLIRFQTSDGGILFGEAPENFDRIEGKDVVTYDGDELSNLTGSNKTARVVKVLSPLATTPIIYGIGLNYKNHLAETGLPTPKYPVYFSKPPDALAGPFEDIPIPPCVRKLDYEGELTFVIGRDCKDLEENHDPADYILGYMCGNDVSGREWQTQDAAGGQHHVAKSFDSFAPVGPILASCQVIPDAMNLQLETRVNGEVRQTTNTNDLLFSITDILVNLTRGKTVRKGTVVMTGTPGGVAAFMKPPAWVEDGGVVEVRIEGLGTLRNKHVFV
ncbi:hypothetical protein LTR78_001776 [Recurvomyces mirabilis]|uniref:Fumarylacetoacetase-like C-terminal domain-containing protein n=1 Tax=Recurvomyces mirabilis TaxID=574656 RepID=A0AAE0WVA4_9PEZI|nr:hypothetical protein LTR78_001776 [Recurvomyces mirabilis]KAK5156785.1 hypothetical protein LTS14_004998 [Recurvomyces mirabilis]